MRKLLLLLTATLLVQLATAQRNDTTINKSILSDSSRPESLSEVIVRSKKPLVQLLPDKTIINVDAAVTNAGATVLEVLEKSPGITIDRNGTLRLKGRQGVLIMIDGKPAQISGNDLNNFLSGMSASQVDVIEIMDNPSAKFDAAGNAGIINIKTKKNRQDGFNGNLSTAFAQGRYARTFNSLSLNYNTGKVNVFANIAGNYNQNFTDLYAIRSYYAEDNKTVASMLEQPSYFKGKAPSQTMKAGLDYQLNPKTQLGFLFSESGFRRSSQGNNNAIWMDYAGNTDSLIETRTNNREYLQNFTFNLNGRHAFSSASELTADFDFLGYRLRNNQSFSNELIGAGAYVEDILGHLPSNIKIFTGKADYTIHLKQGSKIESGWKSSRVKTNNRAEYFLQTNGTSLPDYNKTNHFIYEENIHAVYVNGEKKIDEVVVQAGLRYENTSYDANQLGNPQRKDSSFSRKYDGLFPTVMMSMNLDSNQSLSFSAGRRIDRPPFQTLNPFVFVINKYTYQAGNPFYRPQYTWNFELSHTYKNSIVTSLSYSRTKDYFSQVFLQDSTGIITYTEGNLDHMQNIGLSVAVQASPLSWWSVSGQAALNHKKIAGFIWDERKTSRIQASFNINNQFIFTNGWSGELSGTYQLKEQELQEITDPTGQLGIGVGKQLFNNKGSLKLAFRDIFYTQAMKGFTVFRQSTEYFKLTRDTRALNIAFTYRFGKQSKSPARRNTGGAEEEIRRVGS